LVTLDPYRPPITPTLRGLPAGADQLGPLQVAFRSRILPTVLFGIVGGVVLLVGLALMAASFSVPRAGADQRGAAFFWHAGWFLMAAGVVIALIGLRDGNLRVWAFQDGFAFRKGDLTGVYPWDSIAAFLNKPAARGLLPQFRRREYVVLRGDGDRFAFTDRLGESLAFATRIEEQTGPRLVAEGLAALARGLRVPFGTVHVNRVGIGLGESYIPWEDVERVEQVGGQLAVRRRGAGGRDLRVELATVANVRALVALVREVLGPESKANLL
jgi:hypothetical protein